MDTKKEVPEAKHGGQITRRTVAAGIIMESLEKTMGPGFEEKAKGLLRALGMGKTEFALALSEYRKGPPSDGT